MFCECHNLVVTNGGDFVLDIEHLAIRTGKITAIVGPNGAGKTTLLETIALLRRPTRGTLHLWGQPAHWGDRNLRQKVVMVLHPGYLFRGTVMDNVMYGLRARKASRHEAHLRAAEALKMVNLPKLGQRNVAELSAGQRQRVNLARAIAIVPQAIVLDEPAANVDTQTLEIIDSLLRWLRDEQGTSIVHTSPADNLLTDICDHVIELKDGRVSTD